MRDTPPTPRPHHVGGCIMLGQDEVKRSDAAYHFGLAIDEFVAAVDAYDHLAASDAWARAESWRFAIINQARHVKASGGVRS